MISVGINGFGAIGKRVAWAVSQQDDMKLVGVAKTSPDSNARKAVDIGYGLFCADKDLDFEASKKRFADAGIKTRVLPEMFREINVIVDTSPGKVGAINKEKLYDGKDFHMIFQGGEKEKIGMSFNARANYNKALGQKSLRVVSCNTTGLLRVLKPMSELYKLKDVFVVLARRAADPKEDDKGPINSYVPTELPSHHAPDVQTVMPEIDITSFGGALPMTIMHQHSLIIETEEKPDENEIIEKLSKETRLALLGNEGKTPPSSSTVIEMARDLNITPRNDIMNIVILKDTIKTKGNKIMMMYYVHQESDAVPENIDAIRASLKKASQAESMSRTDKTLRLDLMKKKLEKYFP
jgi:glyceraldehyde-3-phosphate dehydrogenase (NAD(P))